MSRSVTEYREAIATADRQVGEMVAAIRARASYAEEDWLVDRPAPTMDDVPTADTVGTVPRR